MKKIILSFFALAAFVFVSNSASAFVLNAQPDTVASKNSSLAVTIPTVVDLSVGASSQSLTFVTAANIGDGMVTAVQTLTYKSNKSSIITINASDFTDGTVTVPIEDILEFQISGAASFTAMGAEGASKTLKEIASKGTGTVDVVYKVTPGYSIDPANYTTTITYTITAN